jgi:hypothetical protein
VLIWWRLKCADLVATECADLVVTEAGSNKEIERNTQAVKTTPHINRGKGTTLVPGTVKLPHHRKENRSMRSGGLQEIKKLFRFTHLLLFNLNCM